MPSVVVYLTDEEYAALATLAEPGKTAKDVLKRYAGLWLAQERKKATRRKA